MLLFFKLKNTKRVCFLAFCTTFAKFVTFVTTFGAPSKFVSLVEKGVSRQLNPNLSGVQIYCVSFVTLWEDFT